MIRIKEVIQLKETITDVRCASDIFKNIKKIDIEYEQENLILFCLDTKMNIINAEIVFKGGLNGCLIDLKTLYRKALLANANKIIIAHNHPSGNLTPSQADKDVFKETQKAGEIIQLGCLDSIIFNKTMFYSIKEND